MNQGRWAEACPKFDAILATQQNAALLINIGDCHAHDGKLATAYADYMRARVLNSGTPTLERRQALENEIQKRLTDLLPRIPTLEIRVDTPVPDLTVRRDGQPVLPGARDTPLRVDPGTHEVTAEAPGLRPKKYVITLKAGDKQIVNVALSAEPEKASTRYAGAIAAGSVAVVLGGVTAGLGAWTVSSHHDIVTKCALGEQACRDEAAALQNRGIATNVVLGLAGAAAVTAGVLFFVEHSKVPKVEAALTPAGLTVQTRW